MHNLFNGLGKLTAFYLKTNKWKMLFWVIGIVALTLIIPPTFESMYPNKSDMQPIVETSQNPAMEAMLGPGKFEHVSVGVLFTHEMLLFTGILVAIMSILLVAKDTRGDESTGRIEMIRALPIGKMSPLISSMMNMIIVNLAIGILITITLPLLNIESIDVKSSLLRFIAKYDWYTFGLIATLFAQLVETTSNVTGLKHLSITISYLIRNRDVLNDSISMIPPLGWLTHICFFRKQLRPLVLMFIVGIILIMITMYLYLNRDLESGLLPSKPGNKYAKNIGYRQLACKSNYIKSELFPGQLVCLYLVPHTAQSLVKWTTLLVIMKCLRKC